MFYYFGYGSNLSIVSLRAKGVDALGSEPAILSGWRICFDIPDFFAIEGCTGNVRRSPGDEVHGVLHACRDADLRILDRLEALGVSYERIEASVVTYRGRRVQAYVYVGLPEVVDGVEGLPSERYKNILVRGAKEMRLDQDHVARLEAQATVPSADLPPYRVPEALPPFSLEELAQSEDHVALGGAVFDMSGARPRHAYLRKLLAGTDATLLFLQRMDTSDGRESPADVAESRLSAEQERYLNAYLHEFDREYALVGRLDRTKAPTDPSALAGDVGATERPPMPSSWAPASFANPRRDDLADAVPAARTVRKAEETNRALGHENLGFLSFEHGLMPASEPAQALCATHRAWDQAAESLTAGYRTLQLRRWLRDLPILEADEAALPDHDLLRACAILAMLAHAYWYCETKPPEALPEALAKPWATLRRRLGRGEAPVLSYIDLIVYNWKLLDPDLPDPRRVSNMRLLIPTVDNDAERIFYLTQTEILARGAPVVGAAVRAQAASLVDDREAFEAALIAIIGAMRSIVRESLLHINPNPSAELHVDPVVWAKTVAPFAVPFVENVQGPSGTSSPLFNTLDVFFGRKSFQTFLGKEICDLRQTYPPFWQELLVSLSQIQVQDYLREVDDPNLSGLWQEALDVYAGRNGFLGRHRMKVYGYLELAFKVGRNVTIGGFSGLFSDRTWDQVDAELEASRAERVEVFPKTCHHVHVASVRTGDGVVPGDVAEVALDVTGKGIHYQAGDRCGVLPENTAELVGRTLEALGAAGDESVALTPEWRAAVALRAGYAGRDRLTLRELLTFGRIRPVVPRVAEALHARTQDPLLAERIRRQEAHHWELWDLLLHLRDGGFDPGALVADGSDALSRIVPPETFRMYSISSVTSGASLAGASEIRLTVGRVSYETRGIEGVADVTRHGSASAFLASAQGREAPISIVIEHPARFSLPEDPLAPVLMFAGGTGLSPFRAFLLERAAQLDVGPAQLFVGLRERADLVPYEPELSESLERGRTSLRVAFSREDREVEHASGRGFAAREAPRRHVADMMLEESTARSLRDWILGAWGAPPAHVYVCGRSRFAESVTRALHEVFRRFAEGTDEERDRAATEVVTRLHGEGRLALEIFSGDPTMDTARRRQIDVSEILRRNEESQGYWLVLEDLVYDITRFVARHPGGRHVLLGYAGLDGTLGYRRAHEARAEIDAMREMYEIGAVRKLALGKQVVTVEGAGRTIATTLTAAHQAWVRLGYLVVEMENALVNDQSLQGTPTTSGEPLEPRSAFRWQRSLETHLRFRSSHFGALTQQSLPRIWERTQAVFAPDDAPQWMRARLSDVLGSEEARYLRTLEQTVAESLEESDEIAPSVTEALTALEREDRRFLSELKSVVRDGLRTFERLEARVRDLGSAELAGATRRLAGVAEAYLQRVSDECRELGFLFPAEKLASVRPSMLPNIEDETMLETILTSPLWEMKQDPSTKLVTLRRTPVPVDSIESLLAENGKVMDLMRPAHATWGIVVDMRQAPARNDPEFENAMSQLRKTVDKRYARVAVLLESAVGVLQVNRLVRDEGAKTFATLSEHEAIQFAKGESPELNGHGA